MKLKFNFLNQVPKEKRQKIILVCIVTLCTVAGVVQAYVLKNWAAMNEANSRIANFTDQIQQAEDNARNSAQDVARRAQVMTFVETQQAAMIAGDPFAWVVREISLLAEQHPVRVDGLRSNGKGVAVGRSKCPTYTARIEITGGYDEIGAFIRDLENKFPAGEIRSLSVTGSAGDKGWHQAALDLLLLIKPEQPSKQPEAKKTS